MLRLERLDQNFDFFVPVAFCNLLIWRPKFGRTGRLRVEHSRIRDMCVLGNIGKRCAIELDNKGSPCTSSICLPQRVVKLQPPKFPATPDTSILKLKSHSG